MNIHSRSQKIRMFRSKSRALFLAICVMVANSTVVRAQLITNGNFESWGPIDPVTQRGTPTGWTTSGSNVYQAAGLTSGSTFSAALPSAPTQFILQQNVLTTPIHFDLNLVLAATDPGTNSLRSFNLFLYSSASATIPIVNLNLTKGSAPGKLSLRIYDGTTWQIVAPNAFDASVWNGTSFTTLNSYNFEISGDFSSGGKYDLSYGLVGSTMTTLSGLSFYQAAPTGVGLNTITFRNFDGTFTVDNVSVVPEPSSITLIASAILICVILKKKLLRKISIC